MRQWGFALFLYAAPLRTRQCRNEEPALTCLSEPLSQFVAARVLRRWLLLEHEVSRASIHGTTTRLFFQTKSRARNSETRNDFSRAVTTHSDFWTFDLVVPRHISIPKSEGTWIDSSKFRGVRSQVPFFEIPSLQQIPGFIPNPIDTSTMRHSSASVVSMTKESRLHNPHICISQRECCRHAPAR